MICYISKATLKKGDAIRGEDIREGIFKMVKSSYPGFNKKLYISTKELHCFRRLYLSSLISREKEDLAIIDKDVIDTFKKNPVLSENMYEKKEAKLTIGQKLADKIAFFGGSWTFIIIFFSFIIIWMVINVIVLISKPFDPFPFILLNLFLSCLAAVQAPIILMSQNRQSEKERTRGEHDYKIDLKAELEIKLLSKKVDHLLVRQINNLLEIQEVQTDYLEDLFNSNKKTLKATR
jgi:uncharacterized membrane protein